MNTKITNYPAVRFLLLIILGIITGKILEPGIPSILYLFICVLIISIYFTIKKNYIIPYILIALSIGIYISSSINNKLIKYPNKILPDQQALVEGKIIKTLKQDDKSFRGIVEGSVDTKALPKLENMRYILNVYKNGTQSFELKSGDEIFAIAKVRPPAAPQIPGEFSEKQYFASLDVQWYASANSYNVSIINHNNDINYYIENITTIIQSKINLLFSDDIQGTVQALLTGDKNNIPLDIKKIYSFTGTAHVLAVSGLHVGIIASVIFILLGYLRNPWVKFTVFLILVSMFVLITGVQPSAIRAGLMAVIAMLMFTMQRKIYLLNIIAFAVMLLIIISPGYIYSAAFRMSVASVAGIALLYQPVRNIFRKLISTENSFLNILINSISVTIAASVIVSPLVAYYFGIYSLVSPAANLLIIPLMSLGMILSLIAVSSSFLSLSLASYYASSAEFVLKLAQKINEYAASSPFAYIDGNSVLIISVIISVILLYIIFSKSRRQFLFRLGISSLALILSLIMMPKEEKAGLKIIPREQYVALIYPMENNKTFFFISDRKPMQRPSRDISMENYILNYSGNIFLGYTGNAGIAFNDIIKQKRNVNSFEVSIATQVRIMRILHLKNYLPQYIDLD